eukprot:TRINITY_DN2822_c1_g2::TRINITY_DN2822_c1_g2_i2::g.5040::m.5040 TRINITY_DN2822_c1_g2::TRINITY_DN2822_c1_g2_i2::g.5040  ORF type:complete len:309 (-),score=33.88,TPR_17/PF13431.1/0.00056,TPR_17/PF13431.1/0.018,TPR_17/PF13431.1/0.074,TPR_11/PF13414.1/1.9,TPR_11/PF13414.1/2.3,TPR_11/PF13414.1/8.2 TRINITY_DN2822_c1_g2_i2:180-1106(-)
MSSLASLCRSHSLQAMKPALPASMLAHEPAAFASRPMASLPFPSSQLNNGSLKGNLHAMYLRTFTSSSRGDAHQANKLMTSPFSFRLYRSALSPPSSNFPAIFHQRSFNSLLMSSRSYCTTTGLAPRNVRMSTKVGLGASALFVFLLSAWYINVKSAGPAIDDNKRRYIEAIKCNKQDSMAYTNLGLLLSGNETVTLHDGRVMNKRQLFLEAIKCDSQNANAYFILGSILTGADIVTLPDGRVMNMRELFLEAIRCDRQYAVAYNDLAVILPDNETVTLPDGRVMKGTRQGRFCTALHDRKLGHFRVY